MLRVTPNSILPSWCKTLQRTTCSLNERGTFIGADLFTRSPDLQISRISSRFGSVVAQGASLILGVLLGNLGGMKFLELC